MDTCSIFNLLLGPSAGCGTSIAPPNFTPNPPSSFGGGGCSIVANGEFSMSPGGSFVYTEGTILGGGGSSCTNSNLVGWQPFIFDNFPYQWGVYPPSPSPDIFSNTAAYGAMEGSYEPWAELLDNTNFLNLTTFEGAIPFPPFTNAGVNGFIEVVGQTLITPATPGNYILEYRTRLMTDGVGPNSVVPQLQVVLDNQGPCNVGAALPNGDILPSANAQIFTHTYGGSVQNTGWQTVTQLITLNQTYTELFLRPATSNYLPSSTNGWAFAAHQIDGIALTRVPTDPISATGDINGLGSTDNICPGNIFTVNFTVSLDNPVDTNSNPITVELFYPFSSNIVLVGGAFDGNGQLTIPAGSLTNGGTVYSAQFQFAQGSPCDFDGVGLRVAATSAGCLYHEPIVCPFNDDIQITSLNGPDICNCISASTTCGIGAFTYQWTNSSGVNVSNQEVPCNLQSDTYSLLLTDSQGCQSVDQITINVPPPLVMSLGQFDPTCPPFTDGAIGFTVSGGLPPYTYTLNGPGGPYTNNSTFSTNWSLLTLTAGTYIATVSDVNGCTVSQNNIVLTNPFSISISTTPETCPGSSDGSATITLTDTDIVSDDILLSSSFQCLDSNYNPIGGIIEGTSTGNVLPAGYCAISWSALITWNGNVFSCAQYNILDSIGQQFSNCCLSSPLSINFSSSNESCLGACNGSLSVTALNGGGGYIYQWFNSNGLVVGTGSVLAGLCSGDFYSVTVTSSLGCVESIGNLSVGTTPAAELLAIIEDESCIGSCDGAIDLILDPSITVNGITWTGPSFSGTMEDPVGLCQGTYSVMVNYNSGCTSTANFIVGGVSATYTNPPPVTGVVTWSSQNISIDGDLVIYSSGVLNVTNGSIISFSPGRAG